MNNFLNIWHNHDYPEKDKVKLYLKQKGNNKDANEIEKVSLDDDFFGDALNGLQSIHNLELDTILDDLTKKGSL